MKIFLFRCIAGLVCLFILIGTSYGEEITKDFNILPKKGLVTMIDLGAKKCIPCKMMAPILVKLDKDYKDRAVIAFIDVWQHREQAKRFNIRSIPTQLFFDKDGKEIYRHTGFLSEKDIIKQLNLMGVKDPGLSASQKGNSGG